MLIAMSAAVALAVAAGAIPPYPGAVQFCAQHVQGAPSGGTPGPSISWTAHHTSDTPETVVAWYRRQLAAGLHRREGREDIWRVPFDQPTAVLTVSTVADFRLASSCDTRPPSTARAVIVMSTMAGRQPAPGAAGKAFTRSFPAAGITRLVLRAAAADTAVITTVAGLRAIEIGGIPTGGAKGYHSPIRSGARRPPRSGVSTSCPNDGARR